MASPETAAASGPGSAPGIDLTDVARWRDGFPHEAFVWLRREAPVWWHPPTPTTPDGVGFWVVSRHADVLRVLLDPETFSSVGGGDRPRGGTYLADTPGAGIMLNMMDDPRHRRIREIIHRGFTPRRVADLEPNLRARTRAILAPVAERGSCEFVREVARELPLQAICMLLGVPQEDRGMLCDWVDVGLEHADRDVPGSQAAAAEANASLVRYGAELVARKRASPRDDVLSAVAHAELPSEDPPRLVDDELLYFFLLLIAAGSETTRKAIAGGLLALMQHPAEMARLWADPAGILPTAVEEIVRWTTPSVYKRRTVAREVELHGARLRPGDKVTSWEMSANRDERVFREPFRFDVRRDPNPHLAFGQGVHYCLGANLARLEIRVMYEELIARFAGFEPAGPHAWTRDNRLFGLKSLPVLATPR
jgi:cytochrome P450